MELTSRELELLRYVRIVILILCGTQHMQEDSSSGWTVCWVPAAQRLKQESCGQQLPPLEVPHMWTTGRRDGDRLQQMVMGPPSPPQRPGHQLSLPNIAIH